ncbi:hypothetical protein GLX30_19000 [Streptomyces sp. Tu 2975]|uniref:hypothetical protein n=1 Tax=Streptomyces sp. Tu 2975 TaxID=2676871 RepID=UPI00135736C0|nr:hypothetical protein [Streptomyces sp. Tu 2975]QIP85768.1 hypothetical protein GLX30_19000 [Streptomyces sp. Tu 2975]
MSLGDDHGYGGEPGRTSDGFGGSGQTRTRLPGSTDTDIYGGARRTGRSSSRSLITVVGVVVLLIAAIAFANQGGGADTPPEAGDNAPKARSTAPSGVRPVKGNAGGIPTGYAQDEQGAQSAAANYAVALGSDGMFAKARRDEIVNTVYARDVAEARRGDLDSVYSSKEFLTGIGLEPDGTAPAGMTFITRFNPVGTKVESFTPTRASVSVWYSALFGLAGEGSQNPVTESWYTNTFDLRWVDGDWKVADFTQKDGPVPVGRDQTASGAQEMADAVQQFGGFTYAR